MSQVQSYRDLQVGQRSMETAAVVHRLTPLFPREEVCGWSSPLRRPAISIPAPSAEGQGRLATGACKHFLGMARGGNCARPLQLEIAHRLQFGDPRLLKEAENPTHEMSKMLFVLIGKLKMKDS